MARDRLQAVATWRVRYRDGGTQLVDADSCEVDRAGWTWRRGVCVVDRPRWVVILRAGHDDVTGVDELPDRPGPAGG